MSHTHDHSCSTCKHNCLHFCPCCDKVYCCKCGKEWGGYTPYFNYPTYVPPTYPPIYTITSTTDYPPTYTITSITDSPPVIIIPTCNHSH